MSERVPYLNSRLQGFGTTIFAEMSGLATETGSINLGQGFPDTDGPPEVMQEAIDAIRKHKPDLVVCDLHMPGGGGIKVARTCGEETRIVMLTVSEQERDLLDAVSVARPKRFFEYWGHEASLLPVDLQPLLRWRMAGEHPWDGIRRSARDNPEMVAAALAEIAARGPVSIGELEVNRAAPRREASWWGWGDARRVVEHLFHAGEVTATRRNGFTRYYVLPERWFPPEVLALPTPDPDEARRELLLLAARAHGVGTARDLADYYRIGVREAVPLLEGLVAGGALERVRVEGWSSPAYLHPAAVRPRRRLRCRALLSPFDSLIWARERTERLFDFRYRIEIYVPAPKRVHGYYVLPFLLGEDLVARVDLKADRAAATLVVRTAHGEPTSPPETSEQLAATLLETASWLGLDRVVVEPRGDLAPALSALLPG